MLLVIDISNTVVAAGVFDDLELRATWRFSSDLHKTADEYGVLLRNLLTGSHLAASDIHDAIVGSVVPALSGIFVEVCERIFTHRPLMVEAGIKTGIRILYEQPREVGADRIANAVAVVRRYGCPAVVVDFGTATSFDAISADGDYVGGALAPGIRVASEALFTSAARLSRVELSKPRFAVGRNNVAALQSGILFGFVGLVDGIVERMLAELGDGGTVIATGDIPSAIAAESRTIDMVDPWLTLTGLRHIYQINRPTS